MDEYEIAKSGALYKTEVTRLFGFLVDEFGFEGPVSMDKKYTHALAYKHQSEGMTIVLANAFHPVDYGFEIAIDPPGPLEGDDRNIVYYALKEDQDREYRFLAEAASALRQVLDGMAASNNSFKPKPLRG